MMEVEASIFASITGLQGGEVSFKSANAIFNLPVNPTDVERLKVGDKVVLKISRHGKDQTFVSIEPLKTSSQERGGVKQSPVYESVVKELRQLGVKPTEENVRTVIENSSGGSDYPARVATEFILKSVGMPDEDDVQLLKPAFEQQVVVLKSFGRSPRPQESTEKVQAQAVPEKLSQLVSAAVAQILEEILPPEEVEKLMVVEKEKSPGPVDSEKEERQPVKLPPGKAEAKLVKGLQEILAKGEVQLAKVKAIMQATEQAGEQILVGRRELAVRIVNALANESGTNERLVHALIQMGNRTADVVFKVKRNGARGKRKGAQLSLQLNSSSLGTILVALFLDATALTCRIYIQSDKALSILKKHEKTLQRRLKAAGYNAQVAFLKRAEFTESSEIFPEASGGLDTIA